MSSAFFTAVSPVPRTASGNHQNVSVYDELGIAVGAIYCFNENNKSTCPFFNIKTDCLMEQDVKELP